jgi:hypothetical protein
LNGRDLSGWRGLLPRPYDNPFKRRQLDPAERNRLQAEADRAMREHWRVEDGVLEFDGKGRSLATVRDYGDFELLVDWKIEEGGDSGVYLRGFPQVQIWDAAQHSEGSGGLYNNKIGPSKPLVAADRPAGEWNTFRIRMIGDIVSVWLNDELVVDHVALENYWDRGRPLPADGPIELQHHGSQLYFRNIFVRELPAEARHWHPLFNGKDLAGWEIVGPEGSWVAEKGILSTTAKGGGWLSTIRQFGDFDLALEFCVPPGGNSGVFVRAPRQGNPAYQGHEVQILDDGAQRYAHLKPWQYTGSVYGLEPPLYRASKPAGRWQRMVISLAGNDIRVTLNATLVLDSDLGKHMDKTDSHPGLLRDRGHIGLQNHGSRVQFRDIRIRER